MRTRNLKLLAWLKKADEPLLAQTGTTRSYLMAIAYGYKTAGPEIAVAVEQATKGAVTRRDLRDDWSAIWPELILGENAA